MAGYMVAIVRIDNMTDELKVYMVKAAELSAAHGGEYVIRGTPKEIVEGEFISGRVVVVSKFPSVADAEAFYHSDAYQTEIKPLRDNTGEYDIAIFEAP